MNKQQLLRLTVEDGTKVTKFLALYSPIKHAYCREVGKNKAVHYHILFFPTVQRQTYRKYLTKNHKLKYSLKRQVGQTKEDRIAMLSYFMKEDPKPVFKGIDLFEISKAKSLDADIKKKKARSRMSKIQRILADYPEWEADKPCNFAIIDAVLRDYDETYLIYDERLLRKTVITLKSRIDSAFRAKLRLYLRDELRNIEFYIS